jgi:hypothetical protein
MGTFLHAVELLLFGFAFEVKEHGISRGFLLGTHLLLASVTRPQIYIHTQTDESLGIGEIRLPQRKEKQTLVLRSDLQPLI